MFTCWWGSGVGVVQSCGLLFFLLLIQCYEKSIGKTSLQQHGNRAQLGPLTETIWVQMRKSVISLEKMYTG